MKSLKRNRASKVRSGGYSGHQLLRSLKFVALYAAFKGKLDPRDWMRAQPLS